MKGFLFFLFCFLFIKVNAQEFKKGSKALNLEWLQGFTDPKSLPPLYLGDLRLSYQLTPIKGVRVGVTAGTMYNNNDLSVFAGPNLSFLLLKPLESKSGTLRGTTSNMHLLIEHLWATHQQRLLGGGPRLSIGNEFLLSLLTHYDYEQQYWNFQFGLGYNFIHEKIPQQPILE